MKPDDLKLNYFKSYIFFKGSPQKDEKNKEIKNKLKNKLKCAICKKDCNKPKYDPHCCQHFCCENCIDNYFKSQKKTILPCKVCKKMIKKANLLVINLDIGKIKGKDENEDEFFDEKFIQKCDEHPKNDVFYLCIDCQKKMCPVCKEEYQKHENHHLVNYERYVKLFFYFQNNNLKKTIIEKENEIKEYIDLFILLDQQKNAFTSFFKDFSAKIEVIYTKNQEKLNKIIEESKQIIVELSDFIINLKKDISNRFEKKYNDIENVVELKKEIEEKIDKFEIKQVNEKDYLDLKNKYSNNNIYELSKKEIITTLNKK